MGVNKMDSHLFDSGYFRFSVPYGWLAFLGIDSENKKTPKKAHVYKDAKHEIDLYTHAGITICFFDKGDYYLSPRFFYDNVADIEDFTIGSYKWSGYNCTSLGYPYTMLENRRDGCVFQIMILRKNGQHKISLEDEDVKLILESLSRCADKG